jgi:hypothetical protein
VRNASNDQPLRELIEPPPGFRKDLLDLSAQRFIRKRIVFGGCKAYPDDHDYFELVEAVSSHFNVHPTCVFVVGSAKLGFSIAPSKRYMAFDDNHSDIDLVIVSSELFDKIWEEFHRAKASSVDWSRRSAFLKYLFQGWLRPDFFPEVNSPSTENWWDFFRGVSKDQPAKVSAAIYRSWNFFEDYQTRCVEQCADAERLLLKGVSKT